MYDTVRFGFSVSPTPDQLSNWRHIESCPPKKQCRETYRIKIDTGRTSIRATYYPQDPILRPNPLLLLETSLPKIVYGNNIQTLDDYHEAIGTMDPWIRNSTYFPQLNLYDGILHRIDFCYNFKVGEHVYDWIQALFPREIPNRKTKPYYPAEGVQFYSQNATLSFYGKEAESKKLAAHGILRMESSWRNKKLIGGLVGAKVARIDDFPYEVVSRLLTTEMHKVGVSENVPLDDHIALEFLIGKYGTERGRYLAGYLCFSQGKNHKQLQSLGYSASTISQNETAIKEAGLSLSLVQPGMTLPPLRIESKNLIPNKQNTQ
jgi:hypothetical protein